MISLLHIFFTGICKFDINFLFAGINITTCPQFFGPCCKLFFLPVFNRHPYQSCKTLLFHRISDIIQEVSIKISKLHISFCQFLYLGSLFRNSLQSFCVREIKISICPFHHIICRIHLIAAIFILHLLLLILFFPVFLL